MATKKTTKKKTGTKKVATAKTAAKKTPAASAQKKSTPPKKAASSKKQQGMGKLIAFGAIVLVLIVLLVIVFSSGGSNYDRAEVDAFAQCLTDSGTKMYGAFWCPHCARTKKAFGDSFQYIAYVECDPRGDNQQAELCLELEIEEYDTWIFGDGTRTVGEPSFEELAAGSGCTAPQEQ